MKRIISVLLSVMLLVTIVPVAAETKRMQTLALSIRAYLR